jgi:dCTP diphosphatase
MSTTPKTDATTTLQELKDTFAAFRNERDWDVHHTPRNLAISIAVEAAELMEHFQWGELEERDRPEVAKELADVISYCLSFADVLGIDITTSFHEKLEHNRQKYPVAIFNANNPHDEEYRTVRKSYREHKT